MVRLFVLVFALGLSVCQAEPYWVSWTGEDFPENQGWTHYASDPPAQRWIEDGVLFIDSRGGHGIYDQCAQSRPGMTVLGPGERFELRWRVRVDEGYLDAGMGVRSDDQHYMILSYGSGGVDVGGEDPFWVPLTPGHFHSFVLTSSDMREFSLQIDEETPFSGSLADSLFTYPIVNWGDIAHPGSSLSEWDYFEYGIVPEPSAAGCLFFLALYGRSVWRSACAGAKKGA